MGKKPSWFIGKAMIYLFLSLGAISALFPFYWMVSSSFKVGPDIFAYPPVIFPTRFTMDNFILVWNTIEVPRVMFNTVLVTVSVVVLNLFLSGMVSYALVKLKFPGRNALFIVVLAFMMVPFQLLMVPLFILVNKLGMMSTYWGMILPSCLSSFSIFLLRQAMMGVPDDFIDAAKLDGCNHFYIYYRIVLPLIMPMAVTVMLTNFFWTWNSYVWPMMISAQNDSIQTLQVAIARYRMTQGRESNWGAVMASCTITALPIVIVYLCLQKQYIESTMASGIKG